MYLTFLCPQCDQPNRSGELSPTTAITCSHCDWKRTPSSEKSWSEQHLQECLRCGNPDLWRQKDFPQWLGMTFVALGAIISSIAWGYHRPILALGILMGFALLDMILYVVMPDVLVCYRCRTKHHSANLDGHIPFDHELAERYRQEEIRLRKNSARAGTQTIIEGNHPAPQE